MAQRSSSPLRTVKRCLRYALIGSVGLLAWNQLALVKDPSISLLEQEVMEMFRANNNPDETERTKKPVVVKKEPSVVKPGRNTELQKLEEKLESVTTSAGTLMPPYMFWTAKDPSRISRKENRLREACQALNPHYEAFVFSDTACRQFVQEHFPEFLLLYTELKESVMRADMWRYLVLYHYGGVYFDLDVECRRPIDKWIENQEGVHAVIGIEFRDLHPPLLQFSQWTMASYPKHPIFYRTVEMINETVALMKQGKPSPGLADFLTGPKVFTRAAVEYFLEQGRLSDDQVTVLKNNVVHVDDSTITTATDEQIGNVMMLHKNAFGYHSMHPAAHGAIFIRHLFAGRWRTG